MKERETREKKHSVLCYQACSLHLNNTFPLGDDRQSERKRCGKAIEKKNLVNHRLIDVIYDAFFRRK